MTVGDNLISKDIFRLKRKNQTFDKAFVIAKQMVGRVATSLDEMHTYTHTNSGEPLVDLDPERTKELQLTLEGARQLAHELKKAFEEVL